MKSNQIRIQILNSSRCVVQYSWITPNNVNINSISHFMITFNGANETVPHTGESLYMRTRSVCTCVGPTISISAVDRCNRVGESSDPGSIDQLSGLSLYTECDGDTDLITAILSRACPNATFRAQG